MSSPKNELGVIQEIQQIATRSLKQNWKNLILYFVVGVASYNFGMWLQLSGNKYGASWGTPKFVSISLS